MRTHLVRTLWLASAGLFGLAFVAAPAVAARGAQRPAGQRTVWDGVYTEAQAQRGETVYTQSCASCHSDDLRGQGSAPSLVEEAFVLQWGDLSVADLFAKTRLMPLESPRSLPDQTYIDLVAFLLQKNEMPAGQKDLEIDVSALKQIFITAKPAGAGK